MTSKNNENMNIDINTQNHETRISLYYLVLHNIN